MRLKLEDCPPALKKRIEDAIRNEDRVALPPANVEQASSHEPLAEGKAPYFSSQVDVHVHSIRKRFVDPDGIVIKYSLDAIVRSGILKDDSAQEIRQVTFSQEKGEPEKTIITIKEIDHDNK
jgi:hypothetical protein